MNENKNVEMVTMTLERYDEMTEKIRKMNELTVGLKKEIKALESLVKRLGVPENLIHKLAGDVPIHIESHEIIEKGCKSFNIQFEVNGKDLLKED